MSDDSDQQHHRLSDEVAPGKILPGDVSTSPEALRILEREGAEAWRAYVAKHRGD